MDMIIIVSAAFFSYWLLGTLIFFITNENKTFAAFWAMGLVYPILYVLAFPVRFIRKHFGRY